MLNILTRFKDHRTAYVLGFIVGLITLCVFLAMQASFYADRAKVLETDRNRMDKSLVEIESAMKQISIYRDRIDSLTTMTLEKDVSDARSMERQLKKVRTALDNIKSYSSVAERQINTVERMDDLMANTLRMEQTLRAVSTILDLRKDLLDGIPSITPTTGWISSNFGERRSPFTGESVVHRGIDIGAEEGVSVFATADGIVEKVQNSASYGLVVMIKHPFDVKTVFAHASKILVKEGQKVARGDEIALVGSTGRSTGPHLHYEVMVRDQQVDPMSYLLDKEFLDSTLAPQSLLHAIGGEDLEEAPKSNGHAAKAAESATLAQGSSWLSTSAKQVVIWVLSFAGLVMVVLLGFVFYHAPRQHDFIA